MAATQTAPGAPAAVGANPASGPGIPQFASLYVGDLDKEVTEAMMYETFNSIGPVASIRVCRDNVTRQSLGYAYVNYHSVADAEQALDKLNYSQIRGRSCRIMWSHRDPNLRKTGNANVFVKNLDRNIDNKALFDTFSLFGNILSCKVSADSNGKSKGYGFVHYKTAESAKQAVERVNGMQIGEKTVYVGEFQSRQDREKPEVVNFTNLYVKNFPQEWDEEKLRGVFQKFGKITSLVIQTDKKGRKFAFVNMEEADEAHKAIEALHAKTDYRTAEEKERTKDLPPVPEEYYLFYCQRAQQKSERNRDLQDRFRRNSSDGATTTNVNLYVKNLDSELKDEDLKALFTPFGEVTSAHVQTDDGGRSRGFGFVSFNTSEEAKKAVSEMHFKVHQGKPLYVGLAEKKEDRTARLAMEAQRYKQGIMPPGVGANPGFPQQMMYGGKGMGKQFGGQFPPQMPMMQYGKGPQQMPMMQYGGKGPQGFPQQMYPRQGAPGMYPPPGQMPRMGPGPMMGPGGMPPMMNQMMGGPQRNFPQQMQNAAPGSGRPQGPPPNAAPLSAAALAAAPANVQKQMIGEKLFPKISNYQPELAGKITGMMLEMDNSELLILLDSDVQLKAKCDEAMKVLEQIKQQQQGN